MTGSLVAATALAGCGGGGSATIIQQDGATGASGASGPQGEAGGDLLGCHSYCQQAGGYGGGAPPGIPHMTEIITRGSVTLSAGAVPIQVTCKFDRQCRGALLLLSAGTSVTQDLGRSDLIVDTGATRTIAIPLSPAGKKLLSKRGKIKVFVTADSFETLDSLPQSERTKWDALATKNLTISSAPAGTP